MRSLTSRKSQLHLLAYAVGLFVVGCSQGTTATPELEREWIRLDNGVSLAGWEGDTSKTWRMEDGAIVGGSLSETVAHNEFLTRKDRYSDFELRFEVKLLGSEGFINAGVQVRSERLETPSHEMRGYQADFGAGSWASLYDESRRNIYLAEADQSEIEKVLRHEDWNDFEIRCDGKRVQLFLNGFQTVDYFESDDLLEQVGLIGLQIHGGGKAEVHFRNLYIRATGAADQDSSGTPAHR